MVDSKDDKRSQVHPLPLKRRNSGGGTATTSPEDAEIAAPDPLFDALHRLAEDMLDEPVPDRLLDALRKGRDREPAEDDETADPEGTARKR